MNIFKKITLANKAIKAYKKVVEYEGLKEIKDAISLIKEGIEKITIVFPELKVFFSELINSLKK